MNEIIKEIMEELAEIALIIVVGLGEGACTVVNGIFDTDWHVEII